MASAFPARGDDAPLILAIDSAGSAASAAVARGERLLARRRRATPHGHAEILLPLVAEAMDEAGLSPAALDVVAATVGPGGFTGIRAGLAAAQGIALAAGARLCGVTGFAAVAALHAAAPATRRDPAGALFVIALESRREDLYIQLFDAGGHPLGEPLSVLPAELARLPAIAAGAAALVVAGDAARRAALALPAGRGVAVIEDSAPDASGVAAVTYRRWRGGEADDPARPLYLRPPDVTLSRAGAAP